MSHEDNPHIERVENDRLVLFFERNLHPENISLKDIWYSTSEDNTKTWSEPVNLAVINQYGSAEYEHIQPHLYFDHSINNWYLYFATQHTDGKLDIFRSSRGKSWADWGTPELVISAGNTLGVGEPTLTANGDLYFVVVYQREGDEDTYDGFDADPWYVKNGTMSTFCCRSLKKGREIPALFIYVSLLETPAKNSTDAAAKTSMAVIMAVASATNTLDMAMIVPLPSTTCTIRPIIEPSGICPARAA